MKIFLKKHLSFFKLNRNYTWRGLLFIMQNLKGYFMGLLKDVANIIVECISSDEFNLTDFECEECGSIFKKDFFSKEIICEDCKIKIENKKEEERVLLCRKNIPKPKIIFIYDTSWLMYPEKYNLIYSEDYNIEHIILDGVKKEIREHINGNDEKKKIAAGVARRKVSEIMIYSGYKEYNEKEIPDYCPTEKILGPDSLVDKQCLSIANKYAGELNCENKIDKNFSFIYTHDGGIKTEVSKLFTKYNKLVFTASSIEQFNVLLEKIESLIKSKSKSLSTSN
jgi:hypothetical protein